MPAPTGQIPSSKSISELSHAPQPLKIAVYVSGHGYGHLTRTMNLLSILKNTKEYEFHIRTTSPLHANNLSYALHPNIIQTNAYQLDVEGSLNSLRNFDSSIAQREETFFLKKYHIQAIISDAIALPCLTAHSLRIPSILVTNFTFDSIYQALLDNAPEITEKAELQLKIHEMSQQYALAHTIIRLPGYISFPFRGPRLIDAPMHYRKAVLDKTETLAGLGMQCLGDKKILLHCFGGHSLATPSHIPQLPDGWVCISQTIHHPPFFHKVSHDVYMPDLINACDAVLGKLGWGTCSEVIGNGYKPFIFVPRVTFIEEAGLLRWMEIAHGKIVQIGVENYESSDWLRAIEKTEKMQASNTMLEVNWAKNDADLVRIFSASLADALQ